MQISQVRPIILIAAVLLTSSLNAEPIPVLFLQGSEHGFVALKTLAGTQIAVGDITQAVVGDRVTSHMIFHFQDGSIDEETTVFTQRGTFRLISNHLIQHGPSFPKPVDVLVETLAGRITYRTKDGEIRHEILELPLDVSNGLPPNLLMNINPSALETKISFVAPTEKPRLVHVSIKPAGDAPFFIGGAKRKATDYVLHIELGGITGIIAPIIGKQPADFHIWILGGKSPAFIREEGQLFEGGPIWRIEQISPTFSQ